MSEYVLCTIYKSKTKCYASLAKTCNVWRTHGKTIYKQWVSEFGIVEALQSAKKLPARCLSGRWGSQYECEQKVLSVNRDHLLHVLRKSLLLPSKPRRRQGGLHAIADEEAEEYRAKATKWNADVLAAVADPKWFFTMMLSHRARQPLRHFYLSLQKHSELKDDSMDPQNVGYMAHLVWGKAETFASEFSGMLRKDHWNHLLDEADNYVSVQDAFQAPSAIVALVLNGAAEFDMRVHAVIKRFPARWLLLAYSSPTIGCDIRKRVAHEVLVANVEDLDITTFKLKTMFGDELRVAARDGTLCNDAYAVIWWIARTWKADTQYIEGLNSVLKSYITRSPNISLPLCSNRLAIKH